MIDSLFPDNSPLRVRRVSTYRVARYPGHDDPDPTTTPQPIPYPWKSGVAAALLVLGETSCDRGKTESGASIPPPPTDAPPSERVITPSDLKEIDQIVAAALRQTPKGDQNPFAQALGFSGLPHVSSSFGTGAPIPLDSVVAQSLITRLFAAEGLKLQPTTFEEKEFTASAQGYDREKRMGYLIGEWSNLADGAIDNWMASSLAEIASGEQKPDPADEKRWPQIIDGMGEGLVSGTTLNDNQKQEMAAISKIESPQAKAQAYLVFASKLDVPKLSMAEIEQSERIAADRQRYLAIISVFDRRFQSRGEESPEFHEKIAAIMLEAEQRTFASPEEKTNWIIKRQEPVFAEMNRQPLTKLAQAVREYIAWARRNGL